jgi:hypothetical protein
MKIILIYIKCSEGIAMHIHTPKTEQRNNLRLPRSSCTRVFWRSTSRRSSTLAAGRVVHRWACARRSLPCTAPISSRRGRKRTLMEQSGRCWGLLGRRTGLCLHETIKMNGWVAVKMGLSHMTYIARHDISYSGCTHMI